MAPGKYFLVQEAAGAGGTTNLPTPDAMGSIAMAAGAGKVALVNSTTALAEGGCAFHALCKPGTLELSPQAAAS